MLSDDQQALVNRIDLDLCVDIMPDMICMVNDDGDFLYVNAAWTQSLEWSRDEFLGKNFADFVHPEDVVDSIQVFQNQTPFSPQNPYYNRFRTKSGGYRRLCWNRTYYKEQGINYGSARDITDDDFTTQQLEDVIAASRAGIWRWHVPSGETIFNDRWAEMLGYKLEELNRTEIGTWASLMHPEDLLKAQARHAAHFRGETEVYQSENRMRHKHGHWVWVQSMGRVMSRLPDGSPEWMTGTHHDITNQKQLEHSLRKAQEVADRANSAKSQFLANMSHEIRTPLNGLMGMAHLLGHTELSQKQDQYLQTLKASGEALLSMIEDVLDISRIEAGALELKSVPYDLPEMLNSAISAVKGSANIKGLSLKCDICEDLPRYVRGDETRMRQIVLNLLGNAIKFTEDGEIRLTATRKTNTLIVDVHDTGPGIAKAEQERIFERFAQTSEGIAREKEGSGLGLSISREIANTAGGDLYLAQPQPQAGAHFRFTLPLEIVRDAPGVHTQSSTRAEQNALTNASILLVEDNTLNRQIVRESLLPLGVNLQEADNGQTALELIGHIAHHDAYIFDLHMPGKTGLDLLRALKERFGNAAPPALIITADASPEAHQALLEAGAHDVLTKPVNLDLAINALNSAIAQTSN